MTGADLIAETLADFGVDHVFYVPAILRRTLVEMERVGIKRILAHSEKAAAYMADGYARVTGKPGVSMAQSVGAANLAAGLQDPYLAHSPVIAITGRKQPILQHRNAYQELSRHHRLYDAVTKFHADIDELGQLPYMLAQAFREATTVAPRPVHLELSGIAGELVEYSRGFLRRDVDTRYGRYPAVRVVPCEQDVKESVAEILQASKPILVVGKGVYDSAAREELTRLADRLSIPVAVTCDGKGVLPDTHPLCVGVAGSYGCRCANELIGQADLVVFLGSGVSDQTTHEWTVPGANARVIQIDINPAEIGRNYPNSIGIAADVKVALGRMLELTGGEKPRWLQWARRCAAIVSAWRQEYEPLRNSDAIPIRPERLCQDLGSVLPPSSIVVADTGYSAQWTATMLSITSPAQRFMRAAGSLGWALPASVGAKLGIPEAPVVCFSGDGALWYHIAELETARRCGANVVVVVNSNSAFGQSRAGVYNAYGDTEGRKDEVYSFRPCNFANIANELGCLGIRVESPDQIKAAVRRGLSADIPAVIDVVTDPTCVAPLSQ